jgi:hypothetical protein
MPVGFRPGAITRGPKIIAGAGITFKSFERAARHSFTDRELNRDDIRTRRFHPNPYIPFFRIKELAGRRTLPFDADVNGRRFDKSGKIQKSWAEKRIMSWRAEIANRRTNRRTHLVWREVRRDALKKRHGTRNMRRGHGSAC